MTPLAARIYSKSDDKIILDALENSQFFECSAIFPMAEHAVRAIKKGFLSDYKFSRFAQLPAPLTVLELLIKGTTPIDGHKKHNARYMMLCRQDSIDLPVEWKLVSENYMLDGKAKILGEGGLNPGGGPIERYLNYISEDEDEESKNLAKRTFGKICVLVEQILLIINQPNLIETTRRKFDKRIVRQMGKKEKRDAGILFWSECRIRGGMHKKVGERPDKSLAEKPLHYVRKYYKPTRNIWVDGYWRGNADLGIHMKVYSPQPPGNDLPFMK